MGVFQIPEPPVRTGDAERDIEELSAWCHSLYQNLWSIYFLDGRKNQEKGEEEM